MGETTKQVKEKAIELFNKYLKFCNELSYDKNKTLAKLMAITCVNELIEEVKYFTPDIKKKYYEEVKNEISLLQLKDFKN